MRIQDTQRFQAMMASLGDVFTRIISPQTTDLYWAALKDLAIEEIEAAAQSAIRHAKHFPKPGELRELRNQRQATAPRSERPRLPEPDRRWLAAVNQLFLRYLAQRRLTQQFHGDLRIGVRRRECLALVEFFEGIEAEGDPAATQAELATRFEAAMARIPDAEAA